MQNDSREFKYLTEKEQKVLLNTVDAGKGKKAERDLMIMLLGFNTGLRLNEMIGLNVGDVRGMESLYVRPETAKRSKSRTVPINKKLQAKIKTFIRLKLGWDEPIGNDSPLFMSERKQRLSERMLQEMFSQWCIKAGLVLPDGVGVRAKYTVHSMRHTCAMMLLERCGSTNALPLVQKLLGHASLASTGVYLSVRREELAEAMEAIG